MPENLEIHEFFVEGHDQERSHVLLHITEPDTPEEKEKGYFFALAEINNGTIEQIEHLQQMIDDIESGYYEADEQDNKDAFESTLEYINRRGHHVLQYKNSLTTCIVGVVRGKELSFAYHGSPHAILFYNSKGKLNQLDIIENTEPELSLDQLFSSILQGKINSGDYFYTATAHVTDYFTHDRIKKILLSRNTRQGSAHIQKVLKDLGSEYSFGGILFHLPDKIADLQAVRQVAETNSSASLDKLATQEKKTEEILSPFFSGAIKKKIRKILDNRKMRQKQKFSKQEKKQEKRQALSKKKGSIETNYRPRDEHEPWINILLVSVGKAIVFVTIAVGKFLTKTFKTLGRILVLSFVLATNRNQQREEIIRSYKKNLHEKIEQFTTMPLLSKILFISTFVLAIVFIGSITTYKIRESIQRQQQTYLNQIQAINDKKGAADASLIYSDENRALDLLQEAKNLISTLPNNNKKQKDKISELTNEVETSLMKLRKLETIQPTILADLTQTDPQAKTQEMALINNTLIVYGPESSSFFLFNLASKQLTTKDHGPFSQLKSASTPKENDWVLFLGNNSVAEYNPESATLAKKDISFPHNNQRITDLFVYNRKVYTLDPNNNQIYKHNQTQTGFDKGSDWIKDDSISLQSAISLAIDGDVFVLRQSGEILKLTGGVKQELDLTGIDPQLINPVQLWTYNNVERLYILEPTNKRIVVLEKNGKLVQQYTAKEWEAPSSMIVNETDKTVFLLDSNKIYQFKLK